MAEKPTIPDFPDLPDFGQMITQACEVVANVRGIPYDFNGTLSLENKFVVLFKTVKEMFDAQDAIVKSYKELYEFVNNYFSNLDVQEEVNNKLQSMLDDGTLFNYLQKYFPYVCPEWFGAIGDGIHDDTFAIKKCLEKSQHVLLSKTYLVTDSIDINKPTSIYGNNGTTRTTGIKFIPKELDSALFNLNNSNNSFTNISIYNYNDSHIYGTAFKHTSNDGNNDIYCKNCHFYAFNIVDYGTGRGHTFDSCLITNCKNLLTVNYDNSTSSVTDLLQNKYGFRRIVINNNSFHSMQGNSLEKSAVVKLLANVPTNFCYGMEILNNYMDSCAPFLYSAVTLDGLNFSNNTFVSLIANRNMILCDTDIKNSIINSNIIENDFIDGSNNTYKISSPIKTKTITHCTVCYNVINSYINGRFIENTDITSNDKFSYNLILGNHMGNALQEQLYPIRSYCIIKNNYYAKLSTVGETNIESDNIKYL